MPFNFRRVFRIGGLRFGVGKRGLTSVGAGRFTKSRGKTTRFTVPSGIPGLSFFFGGKSKRKRR
jgi:hypothetical protein